LAAKHALPADLRAHAAIKIHFESLEVEDLEEALNSTRHEFGLWEKESGRVSELRSRRSGVKCHTREIGRFRPPVLE
jgi:hypothetical protein